MVYLSLTLAAVLVGLDQLIKIWAFQSLLPVGTIPVIGNLFSLTYVENYGAAFGSMQNKQTFLIVVTFTVLVGVIVYMLVKRLKDKLLLCSFTLILAGGFGNLVDRVFRGFVIDYLHFHPFNFPVFNLADCCVVGGTILFMVYILFGEKLAKRRKKDGN